MLKCFCLVPLIFASCQLLTVYAQTPIVPPIACPNYFQYGQIRGKYIGKLTLPNVSEGTTNVMLQFSQREPVFGNYGTLTLFNDRDTTIYNIQNGIPVSYRIDFPLPNVLPKLTRITVNGEDICFASDYPAPSTILNMEHTLHSTTTTFVRPLNSNFNPNEFFNIGDNNEVISQEPRRFNNQPLPNSFYPNETTIPRRREPTNRQNVPQNRPVTSTPIQQRQLPLPSSQNLNSVCGQEKETFSPFLHGGTNIPRGKYPWLTPINKKSAAGSNFLCGGSLISTRSVVTAAHCFKYYHYTAQDLVTFPGRHNLSNYMETDFLTREVRELIYHPDYHPDTFPDADIAILILTEAISFTPFIRPICLWNEPNDDAVIGQKGYVGGWGTNERGEEVSDTPKMVDSRIVSLVDCLQSLEAFKKLTSPRTICAGNLDGTGPCVGDSGGGLMVLRNRRWVLRGIVSAGQTSQGQCNLRQYVIYCDLAKHMPWLRQNMIA